MCADEASCLFFHVIGLSAGTSGRPSRQLRGRSGAMASAVAMPAMATPLSITRSATSRRRMPPVTISGMVATVAISRAKSRK